MPTPLETLIGMRFQNPNLLRSAFVHRSFLHEHPEQFPELSTNERLEFLGDAVLNFLTAAWLFQQFPTKTEGELTSLRAALVKTATLAGFARELDLGKHVLISRGEDTPAARNRPPLLADVFEAVLGAIYLDQGLEAVRLFVTPYLERQVAAILAGTVEQADYRTRLQERAQATTGLTPAYRIVDVTGPDHERTFTLAVYVGAERLGVGSGPSKQAAAQAAARMALETLENAFPAKKAGL
jgi:ribonuclease-3